MHANPVLQRGSVGSFMAPTSPPLQSAVVLQLDVHRAPVPRTPSASPGNRQVRDAHSDERLVMTTPVDPVARLAPIMTSLSSECASRTCLLPGDEKGVLGTGALCTSS